MNDQPFVTLAADGMQPELSPSPLSPSLSDSSSQQESSPTSSVSITTHDISREKYHINKLETFAARLEKAAESIFPNKGRSRYKDIRVLLLRWEEDPMGVQYEVDDLAEIFKSAYGFEIETWLIPTAKSHSALNRKALQFTEDFGNADNLLVVYYAGHGLMNSSRQALWTCKSDIKSASLDWYAIKPLFERAESDVLLILDCCAAASGAPTEGDKTSVTETIAACGFETWTPQPGRHSFTNTLIAVLDDWQKRPAFTAAMLHCEVLNRLRHEKPEKCGNTMKFEFRKSPIHIVSTGDPKARSVELCPRRPSGAASYESSTKPEAVRGRGVVLSTIELSVGEAKADPSVSSVPTAVTLDDENDPYSMDSLTNVLDNGNTSLPHVLVSLALEEEQELDFEQCRRWLQDFPALATYAKVHGMYKSNSTLLILSVPVVVWDWIPDDPACAFIGFVYSQDLLEWRTDKKGQLSNVLPRSTTSSIATDNPSLPKPTSPHSNIANKKRVQQELFHPDIKDELSLKMPANPLQGVEALVTAVRNLTSNGNYQVAANIFDEILQLREQLKSKDAELGHAQKEITGLKSKHESRVQERSDVSKIIDENGDLEGRIASLWKAKETEIASLRLAKDNEIAALQSAKAKLQSDNATLKSVKDILMKEFGEQYKSWDIRTSKQEDLEREVATLRLQLTQANQSAGAFEDALTDVQQQLEWCQGELIRYLSKLHEVNEKLDSETEKLNKKQLELDGTGTKLKSCESTLQKEREELGLEDLDLDDLVVRFNALVETSHKLAKKFFLTELTESENLTWGNISARLYQPDLLDLIPRKFPLSNSIASQHLRMAMAEKITSMIYDSHIFQQYYLPESDEVGKTLSQLYKENPRKEAIFRLLLLGAIKPEVEQSRVTSIVKSATDRVVDLLGPLLFTPNAEKDFRSEFGELLQEAVNLWRYVQRSVKRGVVENEPDNDWEEYEEYDSAIRLSPDQEVHVPDESSPIMSLFPRVVIDDFLICPGYALWSNQSTVVAAGLESMSRNSMNGLAGNNTAGIQRRGTRRFSSSGEDTTVAEKSIGKPACSQAYSESEHKSSTSRRT